jgi:hypothetical protein
MKVLLSRKVLVALVGLIAVVLMNYTQAPTQAMAALVAYLGALIGYIAFDDVILKASGQFSTVIADKFKRMINSPAFWSLTIGSAFTILGCYVNIPADVMTAINVLALSIVGGQAFETVSLLKRS